MARLFIVCAALLVLAAAVSADHVLECDPQPCFDRCFKFASEGLNDTRPVNFIFNDNDFYIDFITSVCSSGCVGHFVEPGGCEMSCLGFANQFDQSLLAFFSNASLLNQVDFGQVMLGLLGTLDVLGNGTSFEDSLFNMTQEEFTSQLRVPEPIASGPPAAIFAYLAFQRVHIINNVRDYCTGSCHFQALNCATCSQGTPKCACPFPNCAACLEGKCTACNSGYRLRCGRCFTLAELNNPSLKTATQLAYCGSKKLF